MRILLAMFAAAMLAVFSAWAAARLEFPSPEQPFDALGSTEQVATGVDQPEVLVENGESFDFGTMDAQTTQSHVFKLKNIGRAALFVTKGNTSCKCTISNVEEGPIAPGQSRDVTLEWHPPAATDSFEQSAELHTNDLRCEHIRLVVRGKVLETLKLDPTSLTVGQIPVSESATFETKLFSSREAPPELGEVKYRDEKTASLFTLASEPLDAAALSARPEAKSGLLLKLTVAAGLPLGPFSQTLTIPHKYEGVAPLELAVSGKGVGDITMLGPDFNADRDYLELGNVIRSQGKRSNLFIVVKGKHRDETQLSVGDVDPSASLQVELKPPKSLGGASVLWPLAVIVPENAEPTSRLGTEGSPTAKIRIKTTHPQIPEFMIRVRVAIADN